MSIPDIGPHTPNRARQVCAAHAVLMHCYQQAYHNELDRGNLRRVLEYLVQLFVQNELRKQLECVLHLLAEGSRELAALREPFLELDDAAGGFE